MQWRWWAELPGSHLSRRESASSLGRSWAPLWMQMRQLPGVVPCRYISRSIVHLVSHTPLCLPLILKVAMIFFLSLYICFRSSVKYAVSPTVCNPVTCLQSEGILNYRHRPVPSLSEVELCRRGGVKVTSVAMCSTLWVVGFFSVNNPLNICCVPVIVRYSQRTTQHLSRRYWRSTGESPSLWRRTTTAPKSFPTQIPLLVNHSKDIVLLTMLGTHQMKTVWWCSAVNSKHHHTEGQALSTSFLQNVLIRWWNNVEI